MLGQQAVVGLGELLFDVISTAYERTSLMVTTNLPFESWTEVLGSERLTGATLDRLTHRRRASPTGCAMPRPGSESRGRQASRVRRRGLLQTLQEPWKEDPEPASIRSQVLTFSTGHR